MLTPGLTLTICLSILGVFILFTSYLLCKWRKCKLRNRDSDELEKELADNTAKLISCKRRQSFNPELAKIKSIPEVAENKFTSFNDNAFVPNDFSYDESVSSDRLLPANTEFLKNNEIPSF